jgi:perosamine synthetase
VPRLELSSGEKQVTESTKTIVRQVGMSAADIGPREIEAVLKVLQSGVLSIGPVVQEFERLVAAYVAASSAVAVNSGTAGLHMCMIASGVADGDEVITTPFSFVASANSVLYERATPVFVDVDPATGNIDPARIEARITARTKAILPVHVFGQPADMDPILEIGRRRGVAVIEDACEAIGAEYKGRRVGALGDAGVFAFYPNKQMTTGEGGIVVTNRPDWVRVLASLRNQGREEMNGWLDHARLGYNYRMTELSAALGVVQIGRIDELLANRARVANAYSRRLERVPGVLVPFIAETTTRMSWFVYVVRLDPAIDRDRVVMGLKANGVAARPYFPAIHLQPFYRQLGHEPGAHPVTEQLSRQSLALPFHGRLSDDDIDYVCSHLQKLIEH